MRSAIAIAVIFAATPALAAPAWTADQPSLCNTKLTTVDIMECLEARAKVWDSRLNQAYKTLSGVLRAQSAELQLADLKKAQRLWLQYRNANCGFYGDEQGTIREVDGAECLSRMTQDRAIELQQAGPQG
jgi:uncharacterized protein YecT (DUF1311 family)